MLDSPETPRPRFRPTLFLVALGCTCLGILCGYVVGLVSAYRDPVVRKVNEVRSKIRNYYWGTIDDAALQKSTIQGMLLALDPYCEYYTPEEWKDAESAIHGKYGGVGIEIAMDKDGHAHVVTPIEDSPAFEADVSPGDYLLEVDGASIKGWSIQDLVKKIKGEPGTSVTLKLVREGHDPFDVKLTRAIIQRNPIKHKVLDPNLGIGYIRISDFTDMMAQFDKAADELLAKGVRALVIDLRFNGGGLLDQCKQLCDRFVADGTIVKIEARMASESTEYKAKKGDKLESIPTVILTNGATASASEIFAACLRDNHRAVIVGTHTYGKGLVQSTFELSDGSRVKLTIAHYLTPSGAEINRTQNKFVEPDIAVEMTDKEYDQLRKSWNSDNIAKGPKPPPDPNFVDKQLQKAIQVLRPQLGAK